MGEEGCNSRHFSWLMKSCFPSPHHISNPTAITPIKSSTTTTTTTTTISCLPDDILLEILTRVPTSSLPSISSVCRGWSLLLLSPSFLSLRRLLQPPSLFFISPSSLLSASLSSPPSTPTFRFHGPLRWFPSTSSCSGPLSSSSFSLPYVRLVSIGPFVFIIRPNALLCYHSWTHFVSPRSPMLHSRKRFATASLNRKIYVAGGSTPTVEEYDPHSNAWRVVSHSPRRRYGCVGVAVDGVFYIIGGLKIGGSSSGNTNGVPRAAPMAAGAAEANLYASSMDLYDVEAGVWLRSRAVPGGGCVVAACAVGGHIYILASHAVELSFWRFNARRQQNNGSNDWGGGAFGEWSRIKSPPLGAQVRLDSTVRFSCVGLQGTVVLIHVAGSVDDHAGSGRNYGGGFRDRVIFFYDTVTTEWSRGPDLPDVLGSAACVSVEC